MADTKRLHCDRTSTALVDDKRYSTFQPFVTYSSYCFCFTTIQSYLIVEKMALPFPPLWSMLSALLACLLTFWVVVPQHVPAQRDRSDNDDFEYVYYRSWEIMTILSAFLSAITFGLALFVITAVIFSSKKFSTFNVYLIFIILPDTVLNGMTAIALFGEGFNNGTNIAIICKLRNGCGFFYYYANLSLNAFVAREIHILVTNSYKRIKTNPPELSKVLMQVAVAYSFSALITSWFMININGSPFSFANYEYCDQRTGSPPDFADDPIFNALTATLIGFASVSPAFCYVFWVGYDIWKKNMLPIRGKTRSIALYFSRIVLVFVVFYVPNISFSLTYMNISPYKPVARYWVLWAFFMVVPFQCLITLKLAMTNAGVGNAVQEQSSRICMCLSSQGRHSSSQLSVQPQDEWSTEDVYEEEKSKDTGLFSQLNENV